MLTIYKATSRTPQRGKIDVLLDRAQLVAGFEEQGFDMDQRLRALRNLEQGLTVFVGPVAIEEFRPLRRAFGPCDKYAKGAALLGPHWVKLTTGYTTRRGTGVEPDKTAS